MTLHAPLFARSSYLCGGGSDVGCERTPTVRCARCRRPLCDRCTTGHTCSEILEDSPD